MWFGVDGYEGAIKISMIMLFPETRPFRSHNLMVQRTEAEPPSDYKGPRKEQEGEKHEWLYWEVSHPQSKLIYQMHWKW